MGCVKEKIDQRCRRFLWGGSIESKKRSCIGWNTVCQPKTEGGLNLYQLEAWNKALLCKILWDFHCKKDCLWVKWVHGVYLRRNDSVNILLNAQGINVEAEDEVNEDGYSLAVWKHTATYRDSPLMKFLFGIRDELILKSGSIEAAMGLFKSWSHAGKFLIAKAYDFFRCKAGKVWWKGLVWNHLATPKHCFMLWMSVSEGLLTSDKLLCEDDEKTCIFCKLEVESIHHLFFKCSVTAGIWRQVCTWLGITKRFSSIHSFLNWLNHKCRGTSLRNKARKCSISVTCYWIWQCRNKARFDNNYMPAAILVKQIKTHLCFLMQTAHPLLSDG